MGILLSYIFFILSTSSQYANACYSSIFSFGDSLADTGNLLRIKSSANPLPHFAFPPYGKTFFNAPTGRFSDGRVVIDFIAEYVGLSYVQPYIGSENFGDSVNFAVAGATVLDTEFFEERGFYDPYTQGSLKVQLRWFKKMFSSLCRTSSGRSIREVRSFVSPVVHAIGSAINELINMGATTIVVPGYLPIGCLPSYLTKFGIWEKEAYDPSTGCLVWLNDFAQYHNKMLRIELNRIQELHPHATIIYADYYNAAMQIYRSPKEFGFTKGSLTACCGGGGPYNYNSSIECGYPPSNVCDDPSLYVNWDGLHFSEAANKLISKELFEGPYTIPRINTLWPCSEGRVKQSHWKGLRTVQ